MKQFINKINIFGTQWKMKQSFFDFFLEVSTPHQTYPFPIHRYHLSSDNSAEISLIK